MYATSKSSKLMAPMELLKSDVALDEYKVDLEVLKSLFAVEAELWNGLWGIVIFGDICIFCSRDLLTLGDLSLNGEIGCNCGCCCCFWWWCACCRGFIPSAGRGVAAVLPFSPNLTLRR